MTEIDKVLEKLDKMDEKLDNHLDRISSVEATVRSLKWSLGGLFSALLALFGYIKGN